MKAIKTLTYSLLFTTIGLYAGQNVNFLNDSSAYNKQKNIKVKDNKKSKSNIYTGKIEIINNNIYYRKLILQDAILVYPYYWKPVFFKVKKLIINGKSISRIYGWKLVSIGTISGNSSKIFIGSGGAIYIKNIKNNSLKKISIEEYASLVYLGFNQKDKKKVKLRIYTNTKIPKKIIIENKGKSIIDIKCIGKGKGDIFYKGNPKQISVKGKGCKLLLSENNNVSSQKENNSIIQIDSIISKEDIKQIIDKYAWAPAKDILYFVKYSKEKDGTIIGVIFGVNLKTNKVIKSIPDKIAKATGYVKKIKDDNGNIYFIYDKVPNSETEIIINHRKYKIIRVK